MNLSIHEIYSTQCLGEASESKASWRRRAKRACFLEAISLASTYDWLILNTRFLQPLAAYSSSFAAISCRYYLLWGVSLNPSFLQPFSGCILDINQSSFAAISCWRNVCSGVNLSRSVQIFELLSEFILVHFYHTFCDLAYHLVLHSLCLKSCRCLPHPLWLLFGNQSINHVCAILCASTQSLLGTQMHAIIDFDRNHLQAVDFIKLHIFEGLYIYHQITSGAFGFLMKKCYVSVLKLSG